jgi:hypothetical protein
MRVFVQEYDARLSSRFRYTPAPSFWKFCTMNSKQTSALVVILQETDPE